MLPVWLVEETPILKDDAVLFNVVFYHPYYGWVNRRYRFDAFNNVLYHQGQITVSENDALALEEKRPYITAETSTRLIPTEARRATVQARCGLRLQIHSAAGPRSTARRNLSPSDGLRC